MGDGHAAAALSSSSGPLLDVGCGEQPFRGLVEASGCQYVGMDVLQNSSGTVDIIGTLEDAPALLESPYRTILCTEVLEHVLDIDAAFAGLRRLVAHGGLVFLTVPFIYPLHMEPYDFRRLTADGISRLAERHGFQVESATRLGSTTDVLATLVAGVSFLPATSTIFARVKVRVVRATAAMLLRALGAGWVTGHVAINSNYYLSNGVVLRAS